MPSEAAIEVSKRVKLKGSDKPNLVLNLFRTYGFSDAQISKIVEKCPRALLAKPEATLSPKLRFFRSIGFSRSELPELILSNCENLFLSLKKNIIPRYEVIKSVLGDDDHANRAFKQWGWHNKDPTNLLSNIKVLREHGVPQSSVSLLVTHYARAALIDPAKFIEHVKFAKEIGIDPSKAAFIQALSVLAITKKSTWESRLDIYETYGLSKDATLSAFRKFPNFMRLSEDKITSTMKFLVEEMGLPLVDIVSCPAFLGYSLKQRIIPRFSVFKILKTNGSIKRGPSFSSLVTMSETKFLEKFVIPFQESVPQLLDIYKSCS
ncbi:transcription termination factor MTERF2, chloroplastic-like isoform X2 [Prosopis cineraria]|nr:transcription termination factor MTERF2, chloroplastic-like isoform X2 [Prosopis cineraria]